MDLSLAICITKFNHLFFFTTLAHTIGHFILGFIPQPRRKARVHFKGPKPAYRDYSDVKSYYPARLTSLAVIC